MFNTVVCIFSSPPSPASTFPLGFVYVSFIEEKSKQNITRDIEVKNNLTITRGEGGGDGGEKGFQELLNISIIRIILPGENVMKTMEFLPP